MACARGVNAKFPCPVCHVPAQFLKRTSMSFEKRTHKEGMDVMKLRAQRTAKEHEKALQNIGLRNIKVRDILYYASMPHRPELLERLLVGASFQRS